MILLTSMWFCCIGDNAPVEIGGLYNDFLWFVTQYHNPRNNQILKDMANNQVLKTHTFKFKIEGVEMCTQCYCAFRKISKATFYRLAAMHWANKVNFVHKGSLTQKGNFRKPDTEQLQSWMSNYFKIMGCVDPVKGTLELPHATKKEVFDDYIMECTGPIDISKNSFYNFWAKEFKHVICRKSKRLGKCRICTDFRTSYLYIVIFQYNYRVYRLEHEKEEIVRKEIFARFCLHKRFVMMERLDYINAKENSQRSPDNFLTIACGNFFNFIKQMMFFIC